MGKNLIIKGADFCENAYIADWQKILITPMAPELFKYYIRESDGVYTQNSYQRSYYCAVEQGKTYKIVFADQPAPHIHTLSRYGFYQSLPVAGSVSPDYGINTEYGTVDSPRKATVTLTAPFNGYLIVGHIFEQTEGTLALNEVYKLKE